MLRRWWKTVDYSGRGLYYGTGKLPSDCGKLPLRDGKLPSRDGKLLLRD